MTIFRISDHIYKNRIFVYLISFLSIIFYLVIDFDISIPIFIVLWMICAKVLIKFTFNIDDLKISNGIFNLSFSIYIIFMLLTNILYVSNPFNTYFFTPDSNSFYQDIFTLSQNPNYLGPAPLDLTNERVMNRGTGIFYLGWIIGRFSYFVGGNNPIIIHQIVVIFCVSLINVFIYNSSIKFFNQNISKYISITYGIFSFSLLYSSLLLRDMHVALLITIGFYILLGEFKLKNIFILLLLAIITFIFRPTHGLFYSLMILFYIYFPLKHYKFTFLFLIFFIAIFFITFFLNTDFADNLIDRSHLYTEYHSEKIDEAAGGASLIYSYLPDLTHPFINIVQSQLNPFSLFTSYTVPSHRENSGQIQYLSLISGVAYFLWFIIWAFIIYAVFIGKFKTLLPFKLYYSFLLAIILLLLGGFSSADPRRLFGVYPIIYLSSLYMYYMIDNKKRSLIVNLASFIFITVSIVFKFFI